ncbi:putative NAD(P)H-dependent D-xylose reductase [Triangularia setosa]|uniref:NAD(P)H-dependent D-xylose reductase n=1 Tax=Triangularia setosa TaxID=2587417 RepID=A0AAN7A4U1_9PEZI|nr:putative NAD(P)H-dependent D-xylose reductase [Podospora setosa]
MLSVKQPFSRFRPTIIIIPNGRHQPLPSSSPIHSHSQTITTMSNPEPPSGSLAQMPALIYGTAWKKDRTADLVYEAIKSGFRGIDTAAMRRHYDEALVGEGVRRAISEGIVSRKDLWIQTKFTPYDPSPQYSTSSPIPDQLSASITSSLINLSTPDDDHCPPYLDALILHSPFQTLGENTAAWSALSQFVPDKIHHLGISNCPPSFLPIFSSFLSGNPSLPKVSIIQNRLRAGEYNWDISTRKFCHQHGIKYQGFWTLTGNVDVWRHEKVVREVKEEIGLGGLEEAWYALLMEGEGVTVLDGTTKREHMEGDLGVMEKVRRWKAEKEENEKAWGRWVGEVRRLIGGSGYEAA